MFCWNCGNDLKGSCSKKMHPLIFTKSVLHRWTENQPHKAIWLLLHSSSFKAQEFFPTKGLSWLFQHAIFQIQGKQISLFKSPCITCKTCNIDLGLCRWPTIKKGGNECVEKLKPIDFAKDQKDLLPLGQYNSLFLMETTCSDFASLIVLLQSDPIEYEAI